MPPSEHEQLHQGEPLRLEYRSVYDEPEFVRVDAGAMARLAGHVLLGVLAALAALLAGLMLWPTPQWSSLDALGAALCCALACAAGVCCGFVAADAFDQAAAQW